MSVAPTPPSVAPPSVGPPSYEPPSYEPPSYGPPSTPPSVDAPPSKKSRTTAMCCMLSAALSPASAGLSSEIGEYTRVSTTRPLTNALDPTVTLVCSDCSAGLTSTQSYGFPRGLLVFSLPA